MTLVSNAGATRIASSVPLACRLCRQGTLAHLMMIDGRNYLRCGRCECTLVATGDLPTRTIEGEQYRLHRNDIADPKYRAFVGRVIEPLSDVLEPGADGLDYGCGPGPVGATMLRERGFEVAEYDPIFAPNPVALAYDYDFILCSEVVEHFHEPAREFDRLQQLLRRGGWLAIMTAFQSVDRLFAQWHYRRDPTHVAFYREGTFRRIAKDRGWELLIPCPDVAMFRRPATDPFGRDENQ